MNSETSDPAAVGLVVFDQSVHSPGVGGDDPLVLFPEFMKDDVAVYRVDVIPIVKALNAEGFNLRYAFAPGRRTWLREQSAEEVALQLSIGVAAGAPWFLLATHLARRGGSRVEVRITRARKIRGRRMWDAKVVELSGTAEEVSEALRLLNMETLGDD